MTDWSAFEARYGVIPVQIRPDLVVSIAPVPHDLTKAEAEKIARVIIAYSTTGDGE